MQDFFEIQILEDSEKAAIKGFYAALASKDPATIENEFKACLKRYERLKKAYFLLQENFVFSNGLKNAEDYTVILQSGGFAQIINLYGDDDPADIEGLP